MGRRKKNMKTEEKQSYKLEIGTVYQKKAGDNFYYRYQINGTRKTVSLNTRDLDEAIKYVREKLMPIVTDKRMALQKARSAFLKCVYNMSEIISDIRYDS